MKGSVDYLSRRGIVAALLTLALLAGGMLAWGGLGTRAGEADLAGVRPHAETSRRCSACHVAPWSSETMSDRCVLCHTELSAQLRDPTSLHGYLMRSSETLSCYDCHPEHRGSNAGPTALDPSAFPHQATGYSLEGHQQTAEDLPFACADCHGQDRTYFDPGRCTDCHGGLDDAYLQAHVDTFGTDCLACHDGLDTYGQRFQHSQTSFLLQGQHALLACADCHLGARSTADLRGTPQDCVSCHQADDPHDGEFGQNCATCHTPQDWQKVTSDPK